jgi:hypothetical protein
MSVRACNVEISEAMLRFEIEVLTHYSPESSGITLRQGEGFTGRGHGTEEGLEESKRKSQAEKAEENIAALYQRPRNPILVRTRLTIREKTRLNVQFKPHGVR